MVLALTNSRWVSTRGKTKTPTTQNFAEKRVTMIGVRQME
jgi:hypothetical protein